MSRIAALLLAALTLTGSARADEVLWRALQAGGHVILIRHASTVPGTGDPPGYRLEDCATQRNLSEAGRAEARRLGEVFKERRVAVNEVRSSLWCRCQDTARLAFGQFRIWTPLNSFFDLPHLEGAATESVRQYMATLQPGKSNIVFVTHLVNIAALSGLSPKPGEVVVLKLNGTRRPEVTGPLRVYPAH